MSPLQGLQQPISNTNTGLHPVLIYVAPSGLMGNNNGDVYTRLHPVLMYVALSGLTGNDHGGFYTGLHAVPVYIALPGLTRSSHVGVKTNSVLGMEVICELIAGTPGKDKTKTNSMVPPCLYSF